MDQVEVSFREGMVVFSHKGITVSINVEETL